MPQFLQRLLGHAPTLSSQPAPARAARPAVHAHGPLPPALVGLLATHSPMPALVMLQSQDEEEDAERTASAQQRASRGW